MVIIALFVLLVTYAAIGVFFSYIVRLCVGPAPFGKQEEQEVFLAIVGILWPGALTIIVVDFFIRLLGNVFRGR